MFAKKGHGWFWYAFWSLAGAACIYLVARFFQTTADKQHKIKTPKKNPAEKELFI